MRVDALQAQVAVDGYITGAQPDGVHPLVAGGVIGHAAGEADGAAGILGNGKGRGAGQLDHAVVGGGLRGHVVIVQDGFAARRARPGISHTWACHAGGCLGTRRSLPCRRTCGCGTISGTAALLCAPGAQPLDIDHAVAGRVFGQGLCALVAGSPLFGSTLALGTMTGNLEGDALGMGTGT